MIELKMTRAEAIRLQHGLTHKQLAQRVGCSRTNLCLKLNGHGGMRATTLRRLADALAYEGDPGALLDDITLREVAE